MNYSVRAALGRVRSCRAAGRLSAAALGARSPSAAPRAV